MAGRKGQEEEEEEEEEEDAKTSLGRLLPGCPSTTIYIQVYNTLHWLLLMTEMQCCF